MESTRDRTYGRTGSQNLSDRTRDFSEDLRSEERDQVESDKVQKDAGDKKLSSTAPRSWRSNLSPPFASRTAGVRMEVDSWLNSSQLLLDEIEGDNISDYSPPNFEFAFKNTQFRDKYSGIGKLVDRNGTTTQTIDNQSTGVSVLGHQLSGSEEEESLIDLTESARDYSQDRFMVEDALPSDSQYSDEFNELSPELLESKSTFRNQRHSISQDVIDMHEDDKYFLDDKLLGHKPPVGVDTLAINILGHKPPVGVDTLTIKNSHSTDNFRARYDKLGKGDVSRLDDNYRLPHEQNKYHNSENKSRGNEPQEHASSRNHIKDSAETDLVMRMREEERGRLGRYHLSDRQVPMNTSRTTGEVKSHRSTSQSGPQATSSNESSMLRPMSSHRNGSMLPTQREREQESLEETKARHLVATSTPDRGSLIRKDKSRYLIHTGLVPTSSSEAF